MENKMTVIGTLVGALGFIALKAWIVMGLWNWLVAGLLGVGTLTFWPAVGLIVLCNLLFKHSVTVKRN